MLKLLKNTKAGRLSRLSLLICALMSFFKTSAAQSDAQTDYDSIKTPTNAKWLEGVDLAQVPKFPIRPVGSGLCPESTCDGTDNDLCFESCGNDPAPEDIYGCPQDHQWALTFDDGPSNYTIELLDMLDKENVKATFCVMGAHVEQYPDIVKRIYESGHQLASHTYSHPHLMSLTNEQIIYEVKATEDAIEKAVGVRPKYIRPPFGEADKRVKGLLKLMGYKVLLWNVDPTDYDVYMLRDASSKIQGSFKMAAQGNDTGLNLHEDAGFISLQHDLYKESIEQVPRVIDFLRSHGYKFSTAAECNKDTEPHHIVNPAAASVKNATSSSSILPSSSSSMPSSSTSQSTTSSTTSAQSSLVHKKNKSKSGASSSLKYSGYALPIVIGVTMYFAGLL